jgi:hypothetical protein
MESYPGFWLENPFVDVDELVLVVLRELSELLAQRRREVVLALRC